jgi:hypothetical protein
MRSNHRFFRLTTTVALGALLWDSVVPRTAAAQPAPPPLPAAAPAQPDLNQADPPTRVGRIARVAGAVSFHDQGDTQWTAAAVNYPVTAGNAFWTEPAAETQLEISDSRITLAGGSEFDVATLDPAGLQGVVAQGEIYIHARGLAPDEVWSIQTPRGLVRLGGEGRYDIVVGTTSQPTLVTVLDGSAQVEGPNLSLRLQPGQTATLSGTDTFEGSIGPAVRGAFLVTQLEAERPRPVPAVAVPAQVAAMPGGADLYSEGNWSDAPQYGRVWYPPVASDWVPYRHGHWAYVAPWGWTWIDDARWGFAPFHYGRWLQIGGRWAWTPGVVAVAGPPVYAPALVTFIGIGAGVALGAALASRSVGWVPLGPREPFRPWYHTSDRYVRAVNVNHVTNITTINSVTNNVTVNNFANRGGATSVPAAVMLGSRPVQAVARPITAQQSADFRPIMGQQPLRPTSTTAGVTPVVARRLNLAPAIAARSAPGPVVPSRAPGGPAGGFVRPALAPGANSGPGNAASRPVPAATPGAAPDVPPGATPSGVPGTVPAGPQGAHPGPGVPGAGVPGPGVQPAEAQPNRPAFALPGTTAAGPAAGPGAGGTTVAPQPNRPGFVPPGTQPAMPQVIRPSGTGAAPFAPQPNRPAFASPGTTAALPAARSGAGGTPVAPQPNRPGSVPPGTQPAMPQVIRPSGTPAPPFAPPVNRPGGLGPAPQPAVRAPEPGFARPAPAVTAPQQPAPRPVPQTAPPARSFIPPAASPRPEPRIFAPPPATPVARPAPPPAPIARLAPPPQAAPAPRPAPPPAAPHPPPAPAARDKRPGQF